MQIVESLVLSAQPAERREKTVIILVLVLVLVLVFASFAELIKAAQQEVVLLPTNLFLIARRLQLEGDVTRRRYETTLRHCKETIVFMSLHSG